MKVLILDDNDRFRQYLIATLEERLGEIDAVEVTKPHLAIALFESDPYFQLIISSLDLKTGSFMEVFQHFKQNEYSVPFVTYTTDEVESAPPGVELIYKDEESKFSNFKEQLLSLEFFKPAKEAAAEIEYSRVRLFFFWRFSKVDFPLYVKLNDDKFVKVLHAHEEYNSSFLEKYQGRGQKYFYVEHTDFEKFALSLYQKPLINLEEGLSPIEKKIRKTQFMQQMVQSVGVTEEVIETAEASLQEIIAEAKQKKTLSKLLLIIEKSSSYNSDHATLLCYITAAMCDEMGWNTRRSKEKLGFASLFHDVTLVDSRLAILNYTSTEELNSFDRKDQKRYKDHPLKCAELVKEITAKYPQVDTIISQHHERPDGSGFPYGKDYNQLTPLSSLFIVAHDFVSQVFEKNFDMDKPQEIFDKMIPEYRLGHFSRCMKALQNVLKNDQIEE
jgi:CheY-like chemotaxis protein